MSESGFDAEVSGFGSSPLVRSVESFDVFYAREFDRVVAVTLALAGNRATAEDLAQDAFLAAYRQWDRISRYDRPEMWVRRAAANRAVSLVRRSLTTAKALLLMRGRVVLESPQLSPESELLWAEVRRLPRRQSQAVALFYADDLPLVEIAEVLGCSTGTVKSHLRRARSTLARKLGYLEGMS
jgi:RNA polymerase sigma-70 factor (ECF subfamily)